MVAGLVLSRWDYFFCYVVHWGCPDLDPPPPAPIPSAWRLMSLYSIGMNRPSELSSLPPIDVSPPPPPLRFPSYPPPSPPLFPAPPTLMILLIIHHTPLCPRAPTCPCVPLPPLSPPPFYSPPFLCNSVHRVSIHHFNPPSPPLPFLSPVPPLASSPRCKNPHTPSNSCPQVWATLSLRAP